MAATIVIYQGFTAYYYCQSKSTNAMNTIPYHEAGHLAASSLDNPGGLSPSRMLEHHLLRPWRYRHMMRSPLIQPFRQMLRPVVRWLFTRHPGADTKVMTIAFTALGVILLPLIFVMLLPLILILLPVAMLFGLIGLASTSSQTDDDDSEHHTLTWHMIH